MAGKIVVLPEELTNKIAAGEVIERPASIVKELLENALDAGATDIRVELVRGGCGSIQISDNGEGIEQADVPKAFERYATSKIYDFDDIYRVKTFGFRGEALPSIASIARVEIVTKKKESLSGTRMIVAAGRIEEIADTGSPSGTSITVSQIFDSVPVRKKFLKTEATEQGYCMDVITRTALSHPTVRIQVVAHGKDILKIPATTDISERVALILGVDFRDHLISVEAARDHLQISGFISRPDFTRSNTRHIYCYVNGRYIRDYLLNHAVMTAYRNLIETKRYPAVVLFIALPPGEVDVNVHPAKMEVRFQHPREIYHFIVETLGKFLAHPSFIRSSSDVPALSGGAAGLEGYRERAEEALRRYTVSTGGRKPFFDQAARSEKKGILPPLFDKPDAGLASGGSHEQETFKFSGLAYIGSFADTYLLFSSAEQLFVIDQHAAHERILFEKFQKGQQGEKIIGQRLLIPEVLNLTPKDFSILQEVIPVFKKAGIELEPFSGDSIVIKSIPAVLVHADIRSMVMDAFEAFSETGQALSLQERQEKILALLACKGAIKASRILTKEEVAALCEDLDQTLFSSTCPHGRPVYVRLDLRDLEKMFKRR